MNELSLYRGIMAKDLMVRNPVNDLKPPVINDSNELAPSKDNSNNRLSFKEIISNEIEKVNNQQIKADELTKGFISGQVEDLHDVLIATEEARLSLELAVQVRNKLVESFKEINNMQL